MAMVLAFERECAVNLQYEMLCRVAMKPILMQYVSWPLVLFMGALPDVWHAEQYNVRMFLFGLIPLGTQTIGVSFPETSSKDEFVLQDSGRSRIMRKWEHRITIKHIATSMCLYKDRVEIDAGMLTPIARLLIFALFSHRQRRLASLDTQGPDAENTLARQYIGVCAHTHISRS